MFDDVLQRLYIAEETVGVWRLHAEPEKGDAMVLADGVKSKGLEPDVEGLAIMRKRTALDI